MSWIQIGVLLLQVFNWVSNQIDKSQIKEETRRKLILEQRKALDNVLRLGDNIEQEIENMTLEEKRRRLME